MAHNVKYKSSNDMRKKIEEIMNKVESGDLAYHDAVGELLLLYNVICRRELLLGLLNSMSSNQFDNGDHSDIVDEYLAKQ